MDKPETHQCPPGGECTNVVRLEGRLHVVETSATAEVRHLGETLKDLRREVSDIPGQVVEQIKSERETREKELKRGVEHFDKIFERLAALTTSVAVLYVLVGVIAIGKVAAAIWPALSKWVP